MEVYEKTLKDHLNDLLRKNKKCYLDSKINFEQYKAINDMISLILATIDMINITLGEKKI